MPDVTTITFELHELGEILLKKAKITEGLWNVGFALKFNAGTLGETPETAKPGISVIIDKLSLTKMPDDSIKTVTLIDASRIK